VFSWRQYRGLFVMTHQQLDAPLVWCWDNLNVHWVKALTDFAAEHRGWLRIYQMLSYAPELNPAEGASCAAVLLRNSAVDTVTTMPDPYGLPSDTTPGLSDAPDSEHFVPDRSVIAPTVETVADFLMTRAGSLRVRWS
jgi:hypothetical protein